MVSYVNSLIIIQGMSHSYSGRLYDSDGAGLMERLTPTVRLNFMNKTRVKQINRYAKLNGMTKGQRRLLKKIYNKSSKPDQANLRDEMS